MNKRGFLLIEVLVGLFLLGLIVVTCLPILSTASYNINLAEDKIDMLFTAESIIEQIKSFNYGQKETFLYDIELSELIERFENEDCTVISLPLNTETDKYKFSSIISKENISQYLWKVEVEVLPTKEEGRITNVKIQVCIQNPRENKTLGAQ